MSGKHMLMKGLRIAGLAILGVITFGVIGLVFGILVELLWNWLMPAIFHLPKIDYWQAFGIVLLGKLIFGSGPHHGHHRHHHGPHLPHHMMHHHGHYSHWHKEADDEDWQIKGGCKNWGYYEDWWRTEGKTAFENYIDRMAAPGNEEKK